MTPTAKSTKAKKEGGGTSVNLLVTVEQLAVAHDRSEAERSDITSSQNSAGDDGDNRDLNLPKE
ncbi:hypothetical protein SALBM311S_02147 [Streptomyces alboniger]|uniref:hypothetical protein n=1 Tax=Streptomyces sp. TRM68367 TaxID=2758415 RepID=UPI00165C1A77|nr:hypothetical protein [Streptomyces sp. TRM68367]MBC9724008.1 hypothetical protein [Streptomyces sp. TRM68367]